MKKRKQKGEYWAELLAFKSKPHDKYAKFVLQTKAVALELLQFCLPEALLQEIELDALELSQDSYVDNHLGQHFSDVCYFSNTNTGAPLRVAFLFEHKSAKPETPLTEQLLRYISNIWNSDIRQGRNLTLTVPVVIYHGAEQLVPETPELLFPGASPLLLTYAPKIHYTFLDVQRISDEQLEMLEFIFLRNILLALKYSRNAGYVDQFWQKIVIFAPKAANSNIHRMLFQATITYLFFSSNTFKQKLNDMDASTNLQEYPEVKTYIEELYEKGMEKGMEKVVAAYIRRNAQRSDAQIAEDLELEIQFVAKVRKIAMK